MLELSLITTEMKYHSDWDKTQILNPGHLDLTSSYFELVALEVFSLS